MRNGLHRTYGALHLHSITCSCYLRLPGLRIERSRDRLFSAAWTRCARTRRESQKLI